MIYYLLNVSALAEDTRDVLLYEQRFPFCEYKVVITVTEKKKNEKIKRK